MISFHRRTLLLGLVNNASILSIAAMADRPVPAFGQESELNRFDFIGPADDPVFGPRISGGQYSGQQSGTGESRHEEVREAFRIILGVSKTTSQMEVARYFFELSDVNRPRNADGNAYNQQWPVRANPVIVAFFSMTNTLPSKGDETDWCAAFVSFCLYAAGKPNKFSALSGSYRTYSTATDSPKEGDIAVFARNGPAGSQGFGHVAFFLAKEQRNGQSGLRVLGGNQGNPLSSVSETWFPEQGNKLQLHS